MHAGANPSETKKPLLHKTVINVLYTWNPYALSTRYFTKLSIRSQRSSSVEYGLRRDFATIDRRSYGYKVQLCLQKPTQY